MLDPMGVEGENKCGQRNLWESAPAPLRRSAGALFTLLLNARGPLDTFLLPFTLRRLHLIHLIQPPHPSNTI